jgi:hypothetical protein
MEYNTSRNKMQISEYGRNIQEMVAHLLTISDREERTRKANLVVGVMGMLNPYLRESADWKNKLWDHIHIISDYQLDVDAPFPVPEREVMTRKPDRLNYPSSRIRYRFYGKNIERMIGKATEMEEGPTKKMFINIIGSFMRTACRQWNDEVLPDEAVINHMEELSQGRIRLEAEEGAHDFGLGDKGTGPRNRAFQKPNNNKFNRNQFNRNKFRNNPNRNRK